MIKIFFHFNCLIQALEYIPKMDHGKAINPSLFEFSINSNDRVLRIMLFGFQFYHKPLLAVKPQAHFLTNMCLRTSMN